MSKMWLGQVALTDDHGESLRSTGNFLSNDYHKPRLPSEGAAVCMQEGKNCPGVRVAISAKEYVDK